jgi:GNAT superfamily N-acetyltransferase
VTAAVPVKTTPPAVRIDHTPDVITITDANTTIGYCRYDQSGAIEYIFVNPAHRRRGYARLLLRLGEQRLGIPLRSQPPISPLGRQLIGSYQTAVGSVR